MTEINLIVAMDHCHVIGKDNSMPWPRLKDDMSRFKFLTEGWPVIMGRKTWESIPEKFKPFKNRHNVVLTTQTNWIGTENHMTMDKALKNLAHWDKVWIIGGGQVYKEVLDRDIVDKMWITFINGSYEGDVFFPHFDRKDWDERLEGGSVNNAEEPDYLYYVYSRRR